MNFRAEWRHWRVRTVSVANEYPYFGWWIGGHGPGVTYSQYIARKSCRHTPQVGEVYSELRTDTAILMATLGEEIVYRSPGYTPDN